MILKLNQLRNTVERLNKMIPRFVICSTAAGTTAKTANSEGFSLVKGSRVTVKFTNTNTAANPTLNINSTGAKAIYYRGYAIPAEALQENSIIDFVYNGAQWEVIGTLAWTE